MEELVIVTGYKSMIFEDKDKNTIDMLKLTCFSSNIGKDAFGYLPLQLTYMNEQKREILNQVNVVPGLYKAKYAMVPGKNNKPSLEIIGFELVNNIDFKSLFNC